MDYISAPMCCITDIKAGMYLNKKKKSYPQAYCIYICYNKKTAKRLKR